MKRTIIVLVLVATLLLAGCSKVSPQDKKDFCESQGMQYSSNDNSGSFSCRITDIEFTRQRTLESTAPINVEIIKPLDCEKENNNSSDCPSCPIKIHYLGDEDKAWVEVTWEYGK